jgi:hypothetical protein
VSGFGVPDAAAVMGSMVSGWWIMAMGSVARGGSRMMDEDVRRSSACAVDAGILLVFFCLFICVFV